MLVSRYGRKALLAGVSLVGLAGVTVPAQALEWDLGSYGLSVDTTVSVGASFRLEGRACDQIHPTNGGCIVSHEGVNYTAGINEDNGNLNYDQGDPISLVTKFVTDIQLEKENFGAFVRAKGFYDYWASERLGADSPTGMTSGGPRYLFEGKDAAGEQIEILDYFVYGDFELFGNPLNIRVGDQVVNWGESLIIQGGINSYLPIDTASLVTPGSEIKEALQPQPTIYASLSLGAVSVEAMYIYDHVKTELFPCSTYFASDESYFYGCRGAFAAGPDFPNEPPNAPAPYLDRAEDVSTDHQGQYGLALKYYAEWLNDGTELGLYFTNQHMKLPIATQTSGNPLSLAVAADNFLPTPFNPAIDTLGEFCAAFEPFFAGTQSTFAGCTTTFLAPGVSIFNAGFGTFVGTKDVLRYYPEDVQTVGASFSTTLFGTAVGGEVAYTPDMPFQLSTTDIGGHDIIVTQTDLFICGGPCGANAPYAHPDQIVGPGEVIRGDAEYDVVVAQFNTTTIFNPSDWPAQFIASDQVILLSNFGLQAIQDLPATSRLNIPRANANSPNLATDIIAGDSASPGILAYKFADDFSWGYRLVALADYSNVMGLGVKLTPLIQWRHDVSGYSAGPIGPGFIEDVMAVTLGLNASYLDAFRSSVQFTSQFGNELRNARHDRDFVSIDFSYSF